ncbi:hypothetical protein LAZ67_1003193 [Cordylochernes scorpioides]|uniref:Transposase n=1 Tax=Cordylochernes scorpioides TaxID=51811 RepID=A0ABY6JZF2_9ARAC|nr:hypothetical protein LAZ67_1003193 [Cordylochernes scorpioides]
MFGAYKTLSRRFKEGREETADNKRSGRPSTSTTPEKVDKVLELLREDRRITVREVAKEAGISFGSTQSIMKDILRVRRLNAVLVPKDFTFDQKNAWKETASLNLEATTADPELLKRVITEDKTCIYGFVSETTQQASDKVKVMLTVFFDYQGIVNHEFQQQGSTITANSYLGVLRRLREAIRQKRPELWRSKSWILHHDNVPAHTALKISKFLQDHSTSVFPQPLYNPDSVPCDFFLFGKLKKKLKGWKFQSIEEIKVESKKAMKAIPKTDYQRCFADWKKRWLKYIAANGDYFEGDNLILVQEIRTPRAHVMEARARQASCTEEQCCYLEYCPEYQTYQYMKAMEKEDFNQNNDWEPPIFVGDAAVMDALSRYGRITSIAPKQLRVGEFDFTDGRREAFILLHDGITVEMLPSRFELRIKGEPWPAFLTHGIKCSKCRGQGHRRANCPQLHGHSTTARRASPPPSIDLPPSTAPGLPRRSSATPPSPAMEVCGTPPVARAVPCPSAPRPSPAAPPALPVEEAPPAPPPVTTAPSLQAPEGPVSPRPAMTHHPEPTPPARPDFAAPRGPPPIQETLRPAAPTPDVEMSVEEESSESSTTSTGNATRNDLVAFIERNPSVSFAGTDALGLGREEVLDLLSSKTKARKQRPLLSPPQSDALAGLIKQLLDLRPGGGSNIYKVLGQVRAELRTTSAAAIPTPSLPAPQPAGPTPSAPHKKESTPAMTPPTPPPAPMEEDLPPDLDECIYGIYREVFSSQADLGSLVDSETTWTDIIDAILHPQSRAPFLEKLSPDLKKNHTVFFEEAIGRARDSHPRILSGLSELRKALTPKTRRPRGKRST